MKAKIIAFFRLPEKKILKLEQVKDKIRLRIDDRYKDYDDMDLAMYYFCKEQEI
jgi:hypothetical protein